MATGDSGNDGDTSPLLRGRGRGGDSGAAGGHGPSIKYTIDDAIDEMGFGKFQWKLFMLCGMGNFVEALEVAMMSVVFPVIKKQWELQNWQIALEASMSVIGMFIGAVGLGRVSDRIGRRPIFQLSLFVSSLFGFLSSLSPNIYYMTVFRFMMGVGYGGNIVTDTVMLAEMLPVSRRGYWLSLLDVFYGIGAICMVGFTWLVMPRLGWRFVLAVSAAPAFVMLFFRRGTPESPRWLLMNGQSDEARKVLIGIAQDNEVDAATMEKIRNMELDRSAHNQDERVFDISAYWSLVTNPLLRPVTLPLIGTWFFNAAAATVFGWMPMYLSKGHEGIKGAASDKMGDAYESAMSIALGALLGAFVLAAIVSHFERRSLLRAGLFSTAVFIFLIQFATRVQTIIYLLSVCGAVSAAVTTMLYIYTPEAYPTPLRTSGLGLCSAFHRLAPAIGHWVSAVVFHMSIHSISSVFAGLYMCSFLFSMLLPYDTKDTILAAHYYEDVEEVIERRNSIVDEEDTENVL